jgi:hypothetical protein
MVPIPGTLQEDERFQGTSKKAIGDAKDWIEDLIDDHDNLGPTFFRSDFHDCVGGCNGCVNIANQDNRGLAFPIRELRDLVTYYADQLARADLWALAALHAADLAQDKDDAVDYPFDYYGRPTCEDGEMDGPKVHDQDGFKIH